MPNRILRDTTDSQKLDGITADPERLFYRLVMKADDFGRYHADPRLIRSGCFPLIENVRVNDIARWLKELSDRRLILLYDVNGRTYLAICNFRQRLKKSVSKFPAPNGMAKNWLFDDEGDDPPPVPGSSGNGREVPGSSGKFPLETETETEAHSETETETETRAAPPPGSVPIPDKLNVAPFPEAWERFKADRKARRKPMTPEAERLALNKLSPLSPADAAACCDESVSNSWTGLFPEKFTNPKGKNHVNRNGEYPETLTL